MWLFLLFGTWYFFMFAFLMGDEFHYYRSSFWGMIHNHFFFFFGIFPKASMGQFNVSFHGCTSCSTFCFSIVALLCVTMHLMEEGNQTDSLFCATTFEQHLTIILLCCLVILLCLGICMIFFFLAKIENVYLLVCGLFLLRPIQLSKAPSYRK